MFFHSSTVATQVVLILPVAESLEFGIAMEKEKGNENWSEKVEDLVDAGDVESAISLLESVVQTLNPSDSASQLPLASALSDLADLYSSKGFSLKADHLQSRASVLKQLHSSNSS